MWVQIDRDIFDESNLKGLNYIFQILSWYPQNSIPRYKIFIDLDDVRETSNYRELKSIEKNFDELIEAQFNEFVTSSTSRLKKDYIITNKKGSLKFNIEEAITFFSQPVSIILENNKNDAYFIKSIIHHFDKDERIVVEHLKNGWIKFENAGGCSNVINFMEGFLSSFENLAYKNNREVTEYFRGLVILDSDKEYLLQPINNNQNNLKKELNSKGISIIHILEKRMMENYMPIEVFQNLKIVLKGKDRNLPLIKWIDVYLNLSDEQKDFLKYYDGFNSRFTDLSKEVQKLYSNLSQHNFGILSNGFKFEGKDFKNKFPLLFMTSDRVNKRTLNARAKSNELEEILEKIKGIL